MKATNVVSTNNPEKTCLPGALILAVGMLMLVTLCTHTTAAAAAAPAMTIDQTLSDGAQRCTIAFDGFAMITGNFEAQSFFPPGKVADYWGFQYLRDNTPNGNGHNTSFLTNCAFNVLYTLSKDQFEELKTLAAGQADQINLYAYKRFPLMKAFRRQLEGDLPAGSSRLSLDVVKAASAELYELDGQISFDRAAVYASIYRTLSTSQKTHLEIMAAGGFDTWTVTADMDAAVRERMKGVSRDVSVALMTYAGDLFSWYEGSVTADVYFCPERQGTYFGSFYVKDAPAIGNEGYKIDEQLTASAGQKFLDDLATTHLDNLVTGLVDEQRDNLYAGTNNIVKVRTEIATLLRSLITPEPPTDAVKNRLLEDVMEKSRLYGELDGEIVHSYTMAFAQVNESMTLEQKANMAALRKTIMTVNGVDFSVCPKPFLYSAVITDTSVLNPYILDTDYLFDKGTMAVTVSPPTATVQSSKSQQFTARVTGTTNTAVSWQVNGVTGGNTTVGTITSSGLYTAPATVPSPANVTVTAIAGADSTKSAKATVTISVAPPAAAFTFVPNPAAPGKPVNFTDTSTGNPTSWSWNFGDGSTGNSRNINHVYTRAGIYTVTLAVGNAAGTGTVSKTVTVSVPPPTAAFTFVPNPAAPGKPVNFTDTSTGNPTSWSWNFGDGSTSTSRNTSHVYAKAGSYTVTLLAGNAGGSTAVSKTFTVTVAPPVAGFSFTPSPPVAGKAVSFKDMSTGSPTSWSWKFGDGSTSRSMNPSHAYAKPGNYTVTLVVANSGGSSTATRRLTVK